jgi:hypothetical protein
MCTVPTAETVIKKEDVIDFLAKINMKSAQLKLKKIPTISKVSFGENVKKL